MKQTLNLSVIFSKLHHSERSIMPKRTYQPKKKRKKRKHGFRKRMKEKKSVIKRRRKKGRKELSK